MEVEASNRAEGRTERNFLAWQLVSARLVHALSKTSELTLGHSVTATSIYRLTLLVKLTQVDITWNYADAAVWSAVEPNVAVISACLPMLRPVFKLIGGTLGSMGSRGRSPGYTAGTFGTAGNDQPHWRSSTVPTTKDGGPFARLAEISSSSDRDHREEWELSEGRRSNEVQIMNVSRRSDKMDIQGQAELGAVPQGGIHVRNEIPLRDDNSSF